MTSEPTGDWAEVTVDILGDHNAAGVATVVAIYLRAQDFWESIPVKWTIGQNNWFEIPPPFPGNYGQYDWIHPPPGSTLSELK
jgi:hypothetical protein